MCVPFRERQPGIDYYAATIIYRTVWVMSLMPAARTARSPAAARWPPDGRLMARLSLS